MNPEALLAKARKAAVSAKLLLEAGDTEGACDRAYYAMFNGARAALLKTNAPVAPEIARTHGGLISAFSQHLVKTGLVSIELGKALNKVEDLRLIADYKGDSVDQAIAGWAVDQADAFVLEMARICGAPPL